MKIILIIFFTSLVILTLVFLLNISTYNGRSLEKDKELINKISNEKKS